MQPEMFTALGEILIFWSRIESALDQDLRTMRQWPIVSDLADHVPHTFHKKLELWRRSVRTLYPKVFEYQEHADEFTRGAKMVAKVRNHIIHGTWGLNPNEKGQFNVSNYRTVKGEERYDQMWVGQDLLNGLLGDVKTLDGLIMGFIVTKMWHGHLGLLKADGAPSRDHRAHPTPATHETPQERPEPSQA